MHNLLSVKLVSCGVRFLCTLYTHRGLRIIKLHMYIPFLRGSSKAPLGVYYAYFPDWQGLPDIARKISESILEGFCYHAVQCVRSCGIG